MIIGITGKSGSGKSTISNYIRELGYEVIDVDVIHKTVSKERMTEIYSVYEHMGFNQLTHQEKVDLFFSNKTVRDKVNEITFYETASRVIKKINQSQNPLVFIDAPLLFDMKLNEICDLVWFVYCSKVNNIKRIVGRNNISYDKAAIRYDAIKFPSSEDYTFDLMINAEYDNTQTIKERIRIYEESNICR